MLRHGSSAPCFSGSQLVELIVPAVVIALVGGIKSAIDVDVFPQFIPTTDSPVTSYDVMEANAVYPNVLCYDYNMFLRYTTQQQWVCSRLCCVHEQGV